MNNTEIPRTVIPELLLEPIEKKFPDFLRTNTFSNDLALICDFREPQKSQNLLGLSFLITDLELLEPFRQLRLQVKEKYGLGTQEIKYTKFRAAKGRPEYVNSFLNVADEIKGLMCNFVIDSSLDEFIPHYYESFIEIYSNYAEYNSKIFQKLDFISQLSSAIISPLITDKTQLHLISDHDDIFINPRIRNLSLLYIRKTIEAYSSNSNFRIAFLDPDQDSKDRYLRDLSSIPDLAIGSLIDLMNSFKGDYENFRKGRQLFPVTVKEKAHSYSEWLFANNKPLKRISFFMELNKENDEIKYYPLIPIN